MPSFFKNIKKFFSSDESHSSAKKPQKAPHKHASSPKKVAKSDEVISHPHADVISPHDHNISIRHIDNNAIKIVQELVRNKHEAYLVGGCVRDLLLNKRPKDFDVTTSAHPEEAHKLFKRSRLIGRRFKLLHVRFGRDLIEVATFRASHDSESNDTQAKQSDSGLILRDNVYGNVEEDALRRDFTINAMYFDVNNQCIYDFANGYQDIAAKKIKMIGEPEARYREDPVRMLRAIRFAAKLDFVIEEKTAAPIKELAPLLFDIAPARLFDEVLKLLQSGHGVTALPLLQEYRLLETLLPQTAEIMASSDESAKSLLHHALANTDRRIKQKKSVSPAFLYAVLLWPSVQKELTVALDSKRIPPMTALNEVASKVLANQVKRTSIPKRFSASIREIWELQLRLCRRPGNKADILLEHPRFRAAYDLLLLREKNGEELDNISEWWTQYQSASEDEKVALVDQLNAKKIKAKPVKKSKSKTRTQDTFEKFDVVEQVKAPSISAKEPSRAPLANKNRPSATEQAAKPITVEIEVTSSVASKATEQVLTQVSEKVENLPPIASEVTKLATPAITVVQETIPSENSPQTPEKATVAEETLETPVASEPLIEPVAKAESISDAPVKRERRSRAKNDPRNNR